MNATTLRPRRSTAKKRQQRCGERGATHLHSRDDCGLSRMALVRALVPRRTAATLRQYGAARGWSDEETFGLILANFALEVRRKHSRAEQRAAILHALGQDGCSFTGPVERRHRRLAQELEAVDERLDSA